VGGFGSKPNKISFGVFAVGLKPCTFISSTKDGNPPIDMNVRKPAT
jgi:hypothetical protein